VAYVIVGGVAAGVLQHRGLRHAVGLSCLMCVVASALRCVPCWFTQETRLDGAHTLTMGILYTAQFLNAAAAPFTQSAPSLVSQVWFPSQQRALATSIARQSNACGRALGYFLSPLLVQHSADLPRVLYVEAGAAVFILLCFLAYFPARPSVPPSRSAKMLAERAAHDEADAEAGEADPVGQGLLKDVLALLSDRDSLLVILAFGLQMGMYGAWSGVLPSVLQSMSYSNSQAGTLGAINTFAGIFGGILVGVVADFPRMRTRFKSMLLLCSLRR